MRAIAFVFFLAGLGAGICLTIAGQAYIEHRVNVVRVPG